MTSSHPLLLFPLFPHLHQLSHHNRDMLSLMREYGSEVSDTAMPPRKQHVQKASVVRQFRRWNPNFLEWFEFRNSQWVPKLGREGELRRREEARNLKAQEREKWKSQKVRS